MNAHYQSRTDTFVRRMDFKSIASTKFRQMQHPWVYSDSNQNFDRYERCVLPLNYRQISLKVRDPFKIKTLKQKKRKRK